MNTNTVVKIIITLIVIGLAVYAVKHYSGTAKSTETPTGFMELQKTTTVEGTGEGAKTGDTVTVNYTGMFTDGTKFDSNVDPKFNHVQPFSFTLGENHVIQGWEQGVLGMKVGEHRTLKIPYALGYGESGYGSIPPKADLVFEIELVSIK